LVNKKYILNRFIDSILDSMTEEQKDAIASVLIYQKFQKGDLIVRQGDQASSFYFIKTGVLKCINETTGDNLNDLVAGKYFGERALYKNSIRSLTVKAKSDVVELLALGRDSLQQILGTKVEIAIYKNF
jgi:cGMP-dependent protein kinase 1